MALGNLGVTRKLIQGLVASEPAEENRVGGITGIFTDSQGLALFADQITQVATRADLDSSKNVKVRIAMNVASDIDIATTPALLLGICAWSNATAAANAVIQAYNTNTPTPGTTDVLAYAVVTAGGSAATASTASVVYNEPVVFSTALSVQAVLNANAGFEAGTLVTANGVKMLVVYAN